MVKEENKIKDKFIRFFINEIPEPMTTYHITPDPTISNKDNITLANAISNMYKPIKSRISDINLKTTKIVKTKKCYWDIVFKKGRSDFYITVHDDFKELIINKAKTIWNRVKISNSQDLVELDCDNQKFTSVGKLILKTYNFKSLNTDLSNQYPLTNMIGIVKALEEKEFVRVNVTIEPINRMNWISEAKDDIKRFKNGEIVNNEVGLKEQLMKLGFNGFETAINLYIEFKMLLVESMFGIFFSSEDTDIYKSKDKKYKKDRLDIDLGEFDSNDRVTSMFNRNKPTSNYKSTAEAYRVKISIISKSDNEDRARLSLLAVAGAFKDLTDDNELTLRLYDDNKAINHMEQLKKLSVATSKKCILCDKELGKIMQLPQKTLQQEYKLNVIDTRESEVPKELQGGSIRICEVEEPSNNKKVMVTFPESTNLLARKTVIIGGENSGKTTQLKRFIGDFHKANITNFIIDHQENGKLTNETSSIIPDKDKVIYDVYDKMPPLAFTEVSKLIKEDMDKMLRLDYANMIAKQVELFVNSITDENTGTMTGRMRRFLHSACMITFIKPNTTINDAFNVLKSWKIRNEFLRYAKYSGLFDEDDDVFTDMEELHKRELNKDGNSGKIIGTRDDLITGITNRITSIKQNPRIKEMLKKQYDPNDDFDNYIQRGKSIFIKIPQNKFPDDDTRDMLAVFYFSRLWLTVQIRDENKDSKLCHCVLDEIKALPTLANFMEKHITEFRRHRLALTISCHGLQQFGKLLTQLKDSGANFIIMPPVDKKNIEMLKEEIAPFDMEDALTLKPFHALCVINYGNQYAKFIGKMLKK